MGRGKRTRLPADKGFTGWTCELREVPPPSGAQMTRRMACTQSSISRWELAMSRSASGLAGTFSRSAAPPARQGDRAYFRVPMQDSTADPLLTSGAQFLLPVCIQSLFTGGHSPVFPFSLALMSVCFYVFICSRIKTENHQKHCRTSRGEDTPIPGQLQEVQSPLQLLCVLLKSVTHCVNYSLCVLPLV